MRDPDGFFRSKKTDNAVFQPIFEQNELFTRKSRSNAHISPECLQCCGWLRWKKQSLVFPAENTRLTTPLYRVQRIAFTTSGEVKFVALFRAPQGVLHFLAKIGCFHPNIARKKTGFDDSDEDC